MGSMYVEPDCNLISGESFIRQIIFGKRYYRDVLESDSNICFLPDVFGFSPAMPQILKKSGNDYFFTSKLTWNESNEFPYSVFNWKGIDGTEILSGMISMCTKRGLGLYSGDMTADGIYKTMDYFKNKEKETPILYLYGHGDGGGAVTPEMLEVLKRMDEIPILHMSSQVQYPSILKRSAKRTRIIIQHGPVSCTLKNTGVLTLPLQIIKNITGNANFSTGMQNCFLLLPGLFRKFS